MKTTPTTRAASQIGIHVDRPPISEAIRQRTLTCTIPPAPTTAASRAAVVAFSEDGLIVGVEIAYDGARSSYFEVIERRLRDSIRTTAGGMYRRPPKPNRRYPRD